MKTILVILIVLLFIPEYYSQNIYKDTTCSYTVTLPQGWTIKKIEYPFYPTKCAMGLKYPGWEKIASDTIFDVGKYAIYISIYDGSIYNDSSDYGFEYKDSTWLIDGRAGEQNEGKFVKTKYWDAIMGESEVGTYLKHGGYFSEGFAYVAILDNRKGKIMSIVSDSKFQDKTIFDSIVCSIRF